MSKLKLNTNNLSAKEGNTIKTIVNTAVDIIVRLTGGKPSFGGKK